MSKSSWTILLLALPLLWADACGGERAGDPTLTTGSSASSSGGSSTTFGSGTATGVGGRGNSSATSGSSTVTSVGVGGSAGGAGVGTGGSGIAGLGIGGSAGRAGTGGVGIGVGGRGIGGTAGSGPGTGGRGGAAGSGGVGGTPAGGSAGTAGLGGVRDASVDAPLPLDAGGCPNGTSFCLNNCVDLQTDKNNCGRCYNQCSGQRSCVKGMCECPAGLTACGFFDCVDLQTNDTNCGECSHWCGFRQMCAKGVCVWIRGSSCAATTDASIREAIRCIAAAARLAPPITPSARRASAPPAKTDSPTARAPASI